MPNIEVYNTYSKIVNKLDFATNLKIKNVCKYKVDNYFFSDAYKKGRWDGTECLYDVKRQRFPTGLINHVLPLLTNVKIEDKRIKPEWGKPIRMKLDLRTYQEECLNKMLECGRGIIKIGTGGGKTLIFSSLLAKLNVLSLVVVSNTKLLDQFYEAFYSYTGKRVGRISGSHFQPKDITVSTIQSINSAYHSSESEHYDDKSEKYGIIKELVKNCKCLIVDEVHHAQSETFQNMYKHSIEAYYRFGFSATPFYSKEKVLLTKQFSGKIIYDLSAKKLIEDGWLSVPEIQFKENPYVDIKINNYNNSDGDSSTTKLHWTKIEDKLIVYNEKRNNYILDLIEPHLKDNKSVFISVRRIEHGNILNDLFNKRFPQYKCGFLTGGDESTPLNKLKTKEINCLIATSVIAEGTDIPSLDVCVNAKSGTSHVGALQLLGRVLRKTENKSNVVFIDIFDDHPFLRKQRKNRIQSYNDEFADYITAENRQI